MLIDSRIGTYMKNLNPGSGRPAWLPWAIVTLLAGSCCVLAVLQYRWIIEVSAAERDRIRTDLQSRLGLLSRNFNDEISNACLALIPDASQIEANGREKAYAGRYQVWRGSHDEWFRRIALAVPSGGDVAFHDLDLQRMQFAKTAWPADWSAIHARIKARMNGSRLPPPLVDAVGARASTIVVFPRFGESPDGREQEWLIIELNEDRIRETILAALLKKYLSEPGGLNYDTEVTVNSDVSKVIFPSGLNQSIASTADASVPLLTISFRLRRWTSAAGVVRMGVVAGMDEVAGTGAVGALDDAVLQWMVSVSVRRLMALVPLRMDLKHGMDVAAVSIKDSDRHRAGAVHRRLAAVRRWRAVCRLTIRRRTGRRKPAGVCSFVIEADRWKHWRRARGIATS
jgi:hypothetical protein